MAKVHLRAVGGSTAALNGFGPFAVKQHSRGTKAVWVQIHLLFLASFVLSFLIGVVMGFYRGMFQEPTGTLETASSVYRSVAQAINGSFASVIGLLPSNSLVGPVQEYVLDYLGIPYQICAFAGAYAVAAGLALVHELSTIVMSII